MKRQRFFRYARKLVGRDLDAWLEYRIDEQGNRLRTYPHWQEMWVEYAAPFGHRACRHVNINLG